MNTLFDYNFNNDNKRFQYYHKELMRIENRAITIFGCCLIIDICEVNLFEILQNEFIELNQIIEF
jgi:hypothetical protein